jgi:DNA replication protein DnaD
MDNEEYEDDDLYEGITETIMPFLRIYVSAGREDHDMLEVEDVVDFLTSENRSVNDTIKNLIDKGMLNVYACSFNRTMKVF